MRKLIKLSILLVILAVFTFSNNPTITKVRDFSVEKGKVLFDKGIEKMKSSENETIAKIGKEIE